jgi:peptide deformylase
MASLPIILAPDPRLKVKCRPVVKVDDSVRRLMDDMLETMYAAPGIGLSAPQVGDFRRVMVVDLARDPEAPAPIRMANPEIIEFSDDVRLGEEGCLSLPDHYAEVERPARIRVRFLDEQNEIRELEAEGLLSACIQHELDHLDGILFVDHLSTLKRNVILRKMKKAKRLQTAA